MLATLEPEAYVLILVDEEMVPIKIPKTLYAHYQNHFVREHPSARAAFKAGITPSRIARQFGISQSNVRKALASDPSK
jgi:hypothetical protein